MNPLTVTPTDIDFSALHERMRWYVEQEILSCCMTLALRGTDLVDFQTFGYMDLETREPLRPDAIFRMHSNTKIVTSVALMMLFEEGRFGLDDPLADYLPAFADMQVLAPDASGPGDLVAAEAPITVRQILSHSAGLSYGFLEPLLPIDQAYIAAGVTPGEVADLTLEELCERLGALPLAYQPGTGWRYSFATDVAARLVEVLSGQRFDAFLRARLFDPLGMADTDFFVPADKRERLIRLYAPVDMFAPMQGGLVPVDPAADRVPESPPRFLSGGAGLFSTAGDYLCFLRLIINGGSWQGVRLLQPETVTLMHTNQLPPGVGVNFSVWAMPDTVFGLGFAIRTAPGPGEPDSAVGEYHWGGMAGTHSWVAPGAGIAGLCMTQRLPGFWHPFSHDFKRMLYQALG